MTLELQIVEISKLNLGPDDTLVMKMTGDMISDEDMNQLQAAVQARYPSNKIMMFRMPEGSDIKLEVLTHHDTFTNSDLNDEGEDH